MKGTDVLIEIQQSLAAQRTYLYFWQAIVRDAVRHMGEIYAIKAMWERQCN